MKLVVVAVAGLALAVVALGQFGSPTAPFVGWSYSAAVARTAALAADDADPARLTALARDALIAQPIAAEPLVVAALAKGDPASADAAALMEEARRREPRATVVRAWLADHYLRAGNYRQALIEIGRLAVLRPDLAPGLDPVLLAAAQTPEGWREVNRAVAANPSWKSSFVASLLRRADAESENAAFAMVAAGAGADTSQDRLRQTLLQRLIARGAYDRAYLAWFNFLPETATAGAGLVYDPQFRGLSGLPPFNWTFSASDEGLAEYAPDGGLDLRFYGRANAHLASQMLMLPPGRYTLAITARSSGADADGAAQIAYRLQCAAVRTELQAGTLDMLGSTAKAYGGGFAVADQGCPAQTITISGIVGDTTRETSVTIQSVAITAVQP